MLELTKSLVDTSKKIKQECKEYNISFFNTSENFLETIEEAVKEILEK